MRSRLLRPLAAATQDIKVELMKISANEADKATLSYRVVSGINPKNKEQTLLRPQVVDKETYDTKRILSFAMENGYIVGGQFYANYGIVNGFLEAVQRLGWDGHNILLNGWLFIHPELKGSIDPETRTLGAQNEVRICIRSMKDLRRKASDFNWECVDDKSLRATVQHLQSVGGAKDKEIFANAKISVGGTNMAYNSASDKITASWQTTDSESGTVTDHTVELVPESSGYSTLTLPFPSELATAPLGTVTGTANGMQAAVGTIRTPRQFTNSSPENQRTLPAPFALGRTTMKSPRSPLPGD